MAAPFKPSFNPVDRDRRRSRAGRKCVRCNGGVPKANGRFCSAKCQYAHQKETNPARQKPCPVCGGPRLSRQSSPKLQTCSAKCGYELRKQKLRGRVKCLTCAKSFFARVAGHKPTRKKFCSQKCYDAFRALRPAFVPVTCAKCGAKTKRTLAAVKRVRHSFCSSECSRAFNVGEQNPAWRGGSDPNRGSAWNKLTVAIRTRDSFKCRRCEKTEAENKQKLSVDHVRPWRSFKNESDANHPDNLVSLCRSCHSYKTSTVEQQWLRGDVLGWKKWVASLHLPSAAKFGFRA